MGERINLNGVPAWLEIPASSSVAPPVETRLQELPLEQLDWEDFERLCVRLVRYEADIEHCQLYGERGQKQDGIDIFGRLRGATSYAVYQCRRIEKFGPAAIKAAVDDFLRGKWSERSSRFVLCTTNSGIRRQHADVIEEQAAALAKRRISFEPWDRSRISELLKIHPELVDDFLGREWVRAFCGEQAAQSLVGRLDIQRVKEFRAELGRFYRYLFDSQDPGIPIPRKVGSSPFPLADRYVLPDVYVESDSPASRESSEVAPPPERRDALEAEAEPHDSQESGSTRGKSSLRSSLPQSYASRQSIEEWLGRSKRSLVIGGPGSGKSSLLRYLITDLFSDAPTLAKFASTFGTLLPIWVPFAFWTQLISRDTDSSLSQCLKQWFGQWDEAKLWPLVQDAMDDGRLLLLVDGLDEWTDEAAGRIACQRLQVLVQQNDLSAIIVTRPYGYTRMPRFGTGWQATKLAPLSDKQRAVLCAKWFRLKHLSLERDSDADSAELVKHDVDQFLAELSRSSDLLELSRVPFLLLLLLYLRLERGVLPTSRFKAFELILDHLIEEHPANRRMAASLGTSPQGLRPDELEWALAHIAFEVQKTRADGLIFDHDLRENVRDFLVDETLGLGLGSSEARSLVGQFTDVAEGALGLLVRKAPKQLGFFHRSLQEYLAGSHVSRWDLPAQKIFVERHFYDPRWRDVLLTLFWMTRRPGDLRSLIGAMKPTSLPQRLSAAGLRAEVAFGDFDCPADLAKTIAEETFLAVERDPWMPHRERLLGAALQGMHSAKTGELVHRRLRRWAYARNGWRSGWFEAMQKWPRDSTTLNVLMSGLYDEDPGVQRAAAQRLASIFRDEPVVGDELANLALRSPSSMLRAASIEGLGLGWPEHRLIEPVLHYADKSPSAEVRLAGLGIRVTGGVHRRSDLDFLLELSRRRSEFHVDYRWSDEVPNTLVKGWSGSETVKNACLEALRNSFIFRDELLSESIATLVLLRGFPNDADVAKYCADEIAGTHRPGRNYPFIGLHDHGIAWSLLAQNFRNDPAIAHAIDSWAEENKIDTRQLALAALVCRTPKMKQILIETLKGASFPHWSAWGLLEGWGTEDLDVFRALLPMASGSARIASQVGHLIPKILRDDSSARTRLLEILRDPTCVRHDFVIEGLATLANKDDEDEIAYACFEILRRTEGIHQQAIEHDLVMYFPKARGVRDLARDLLSSRNPPFSAAACAFADDPEIRGEIAELVPRLPVLLRARISAKLASEPAEDSFSQSILKDYDVEEDDELKTIASISYHRALRRGGRTEAVMDRLLEAVSCYGPDHEERRRAAFAGLLALERLDPIRDLKERSEKRESVSIDLGKWNEPNIPLVRLVAEKWDYLKSVFGSSLPLRISQWRHDCWSPLCLVASEFPSARDEVLSILDADPNLAINPHCLSFVARVKPGSELLLDRCFAALTSDNVNVLRGSFVAAEILSENFAGDPNVYSRLLQALPIGRNGTWLSVRPQLAVALCLGWPDSEIIDELYRQELERRGATGDHQAFFEVRFSRYPTVEFPNSIRMHLAARGIHTNPYFARSFTNAAVRRLRKDSQTAEALLRTLREKLEPTEMASIPRILSVAKGISPELTTYCLREIEEQLCLKSPDLGFDVMSTDIRGVHLSLLDALNGSSTGLPLRTEVY